MQNWKSNPATNTQEEPGKSGILDVLETPPREYATSFECHKKAIKVIEFVKTKWTRLMSQSYAMMPYSYGLQVIKCN